MQAAAPLCTRFSIDTFCFLYRSLIRIFVLIRLFVFTYNLGDNDIHYKVCRVFARPRPVGVFNRPPDGKCPACSAGFEPSFDLWC